MVPYLKRVFAILMVTKLALGWPSDTDQCFPKTKGKVQLVFVFDRTTTFKDFFKHFNGIADGITSKIVSEYPGSEFGLAYFSDYENAAGPHKQTGRHEDKLTGCYLLEQKLTKDTKEFLDKTKTQSLQASGGTEGSLVAIALAATDPKMGWLLNDSNIHKILVLVTDEDYSDTLRNTSNRTPFKGDGTDSCLKSLPPSIEKVGEVLRKRSMSIIGLFTNNISETYRQYFTRMGIPNDIFQFNINDVSKITQNIIDGIKENTRCEWADPPAYNTMGL